MTNSNATLANNTPLPKTHRHYEFGGFQERLAHLCALFEIVPPEITYEDGEPTMTDSLLDWTKANKINLDWLLAGSPCSMLRTWAEARKHEPQFAKVLGKFDEQEHAVLLAGLKLATESGADIDSVMRGVVERIEEYRAGKPQ